MGEPEGHGPVVGEEEDALGVGVQAPHGMQPDPEVGQELKHARSAARIRPGGQVPGGLVEDHVAPGFPPRA